MTGNAAYAMTLADALAAAEARLAETERQRDEAIQALRFVGGMIDFEGNVGGALHLLLGFFNGDKSKLVTLSTAEASAARAEEALRGARTELDRIIGDVLTSHQQPVPTDHDRVVLAEGRLRALADTVSRALSGGAEGTTG